MIRISIDITMTLNRQALAHGYYSEFMGSSFSQSVSAGRREYKESESYLGIFI